MIFRLFRGGYLGGHFEILLQKDELCFFVSGYPVRVTPDTPPDYVVSIKNDKDWKNLVEFIKTLNWEKEYCDNNIMDGEQWKLVFESRDKKLNCFGSNEYPADFDEFIQRLGLITRKYKIPFR